MTPHLTPHSSFKAELARLYNDERCTLKKISDILGVSHTGVREAMIRHGIPLRGRSPKIKAGEGTTDYFEMERVVIRIKEEIARFPQPMRKCIIQGFIFSECKVYDSIRAALRQTSA